LVEGSADTQVPIVFGLRKPAFQKPNVVGNFSVKRIFVRSLSLIGFVISTGFQLFAPHSIEYMYICKFLGLYVSET